MSRFIVNAIYVCTLIFFISACSEENEPIISNEPEVENPIRPIDATTYNVLLIIADDLGIDILESYGIGVHTAVTPNINRLIESGVQFSNAWAYSQCTPTRASIISGKHGFRTNVLKVNDPLSTNEPSIQQWIHQESGGVYSNALIGKWHLSRQVSDLAALGIQHFEGFLNGGVQDYFDWEITTEARSETITKYITTELTDRAIQWIGEQQTPWFLWMAYNAPHSPFHLAPTDLHDRDDLSPQQNDINNDPYPYYLSSLEALDNEIGRLLESIDDLDNTTIIFIGDNGTPGQVVQKFDRRGAKGSLQEGGVAVPLIISGAGVSRQNVVEDALVQSTDLFATIAELTGASDPGLEDSKSIVPLLNDENAEHHEFIFSQLENDNQGGCTIRNQTYKLIQFSDGSEAFYNLELDPLEEQNLIRRLSDSEKDEYSVLRDAIRELVGDLLH